MWVRIRSHMWCQCKTLVWFLTSTWKWIFKSQKPATTHTIISTTAGESENTEPGSHVHDYTCIYYKPYWLLQQFDEWTTSVYHQETPACAKTASRLVFNRRKYDRIIYSLLPPKWLYASTIKSEVISIFVRCRNKSLSKSIYGCVVSMFCDSYGLSYLYTFQANNPLI